MRLITVYKYKKQDKVEIKITQIRETESAEAISVFNFESFVEKIKVETKARPVSGFRVALHYVLPGEPCRHSGKLP